MIQDDKLASKLFVHLREADGVNMYFDTGGSMLYSAKINSGVMFSFIPVDRGWFTAKDGRVLFLQRVPERQWKRGISSNNTRVTNIDGMYTEKLTYPVLESIFMRDETIMPYAKGRPFRISKHFAVSSKQDVYFYNQHIGFLEDDTIEIDKAHPLEQELCDAIKRNNVQFKVKAV
jgi:hypothetical protein